jgi:hypothetical protein
MATSELPSEVPVPPPSVEAEPSAPVDVLRRWQESGAIWKVVARTASRLEISLLTCDGGEEMQRLSSADPDLIAFVGARSGSGP